MALVYKFEKGGTWYLRYARKTRLPRRCIHVTTEKDAELIRVKEEHRIAMGREGIEIQEPERIRLKQFIDEYLTHCQAKNLSPGTIEDYRAALNRFGKFLAKDILVSDIRAEVLEAHQIVLRSHFAPKTVRNEAMVVYGALRWGAMKRNYVRPEMLRTLTLPKAVKYPPRPLRPEEYQALKKATKDERYKDYWDLYYLTGMRRGEGTLLRFSQSVDFTRGVLTIPQPKQGNYRYFPIGDELRRVLKRLKMRAGKRDRVVTAHKADLSHNFRTCADDAKLPKNITFHSLRHSFGTASAMAGNPQKATQLLMGHSDPRSTEIYTGMWTEELWRAAGRVKLPAVKRN